MSTCAPGPQRPPALVHRLARLVRRVHPARIWERRVRKRRLRALRELRDVERRHRLSFDALWKPDGHLAPLFREAILGQWQHPPLRRFIGPQLPLPLDPCGTSPPQDCSINEANLERLRDAIRSANRVGT